MNDAANNARPYGWGPTLTRVEPGAAAVDIELTGESGGLDIVTTHGRANLHQGLRLALTTALGTDPFDVGFGFDGLLAFAEATDRASLVGRIRLAVAATLEKDPRVVKVLDVLAEQSEGERILRVRAEFVGAEGSQDQLGFEVPFPG